MTEQQDSRPETAEEEIPYEGPTSNPSYVTASDFIALRGTYSEVVAQRDELVVKTVALEKELAASNAELATAGARLMAESEELGVLRAFWNAQEIFVQHNVESEQDKVDEFHLHKTYHSKMEETRQWYLRRDAKIQARAEVEEEMRLRGVGQQSPTEQETLDAVRNAMTPPDLSQIRSLTKPADLDRAKKQASAALDALMGESGRHYGNEPRPTSRKFDGHVQFVISDDHIRQFVEELQGNPNAPKMVALDGMVETLAAVRRRGMPMPDADGVLAAITSALESLPPALAEGIQVPTREEITRVFNLAEAAAGLRPTLQDVVKDARAWIDAQPLSHDARMVEIDAEMKARVAELVRDPAMRPAQVAAAISHEFGPRIDEVMKARLEEGLPVVNVGEGHPIPPGVQVVALELDERHMEALAGLPMPWDTPVFFLQKDGNTKFRIVPKDGVEVWEWTEARQTWETYGQKEGEDDNADLAWYRSADGVDNGWYEVPGQILEDARKMFP